MRDQNTHLRIEGVPYCIVEYALPIDLRSGLRCGYRLDAPTPMLQLERLRRALAPLDVDIRLGHCPTDYGFFGTEQWQIESGLRMVRRCKDLIRRVIA